MDEGEIQEEYDKWALLARKWESMLDRQVKMPIMVLTMEVRGRGIKTVRLKVNEPLQYIVSF